MKVTSISPVKRVRLALLGLVSVGGGMWLWPAISEGEQRPYPALVNQSASFPRGLAVLETLEQLSFSDKWRKVNRQTIPRGGHVVVIVKVGRDMACGALNVSVPDASVSVLLPTRLFSPSSIGTPSGIYYDVVAPQNMVTCRLSPFRLIEWKPKNAGKVNVAASGNEITVNVSFERAFTKPSMPFFIGLSNAYLIKGHCLTYCPREAELGWKYGSMLRRHHLTPIQSWVRVPPIRDGRMDLNHGKAKGRSFWQTGNGSGRGFVNFPRMTLYPVAQTYLRALEKTIQDQGLAGRAWVYVRDEPGNIEKLKQELRLYRMHAPSVLTMVTTPYRPDLADLIDIYAPNIAQWNPAEKGYDGKAVWPYASCMGSCGPNRAFTEDVERAPGPDVDRPDFLIDRPAKRIDAYFSALVRSGANGGLYYHAVEGYPFYRRGIDIMTDPWNFGGNGDGTLVYPGRPGELGLTEHTALPSFRLKLIRQAIEHNWRQ